MCARKHPLDSRDAFPLSSHLLFLDSFIFLPMVLSLEVHLLSHAQCLHGGDVHISGDYHQVDGLLLKDVLPDERLDL